MHIEKHVTKSRVFLGASVAASLGLGFGFDLPAALPWAGGLLAGMCLTVGWGHRAWLATGLVLGVFSAGAWHSQNNRPPDLSSYYGRKAPMRLLIVTDPEARERSVTALADLQGIGGKDVRHGARVAVVFPRYPEYEYGTLLEAEAKLEPPSEFNRKDNLSGQIAFPEIVSLDNGQGNPLKRGLYGVKRSVLLALNRVIPDPESGLMGGLLLGTRRVPQEVVDDFRTTGTAHIVAVSGFNVTIVAVFLDQLLRRAGKGASFYASLFGIFAFVLVTGAQASVVRAGFMGCLGLLAAYSGRLYSSSNAIVFASAVMLYQQPALLKFDIGFQLSFAALAGLLYVQPRLEGFFPNAPGWVRNFMFPTLCAQVTTTPLSLYHFGSLSLISVPANMLILPLVAPAMLLGAVAVLGHLAWPPLGVAVGSAAWLVLKYILWAIDLCARVPYAALKSIPFPLWAFALYNISLIALLTWKPKPSKS